MSMRALIDPARGEMAAAGRWGRGGSILTTRCRGVVTGRAIHTDAPCRPRLLSGLSPSCTAVWLDARQLRPGSTERSRVLRLAMPWHHH